MLVPAVDVDDVAQGLPRQVAAQVIAEERHRPLHVDRRAAADVRREQHVLHRTQRTLPRQRLPLPHVPRPAPPPHPSWGARRSAPSSMTAPRAMLTMRAAGFTARSSASPMSPRDSAVSGTATTTQSASDSTDSRSHPFLNSS